MFDGFFEGRIHRISDAARNTSGVQVFLAWPSARETGRINAMDQKANSAQVLQPYDVDVFSARLEHELGTDSGRLVALAGACGVKHGAVQGWLKGSIPRHQYWHNIEKFLGCSMAYLLFGVKGGVMPSDKSLDRQAALAVIEDLERQVVVLKQIVRRPADDKRNPPGPPPKTKKN
jgi:hypothetical protein